jgi:hypothetical protein
VDYLRALKENVIVGRLIPAGTGMPTYRDIFLSGGLSAARIIFAIGRVIRESAGNHFRLAKEIERHGTFQFPHERNRSLAVMLNVRGWA